jgi:hypothetical protein
LKIRTITYDSIRTYGLQHGTLIAYFTDDISVSFKLADICVVLNVFENGFVNILSSHGGQYTVDFKFPIYRGFYAVL